MNPSPSLSNQDELLTELLKSLDRNDIVFFPVRHHSPACAWHIQQWIQKHKPAAVLIEGARDLTGLIPLILHPDIKTPFAAYTTYVDDRRQPLLEELPELGAKRFAGYYPFCDYSPELVALRSGAAADAHLQFIDLTFPEQTIANQTDTEQIRALQAESYLQRSAYLQALAKKTGCRNQDELWDHLFEANFLTVSTSQFIQTVAAYCFMARQDSPDELLQADGTIAREQAMAAAIRGVRSQQSGTILVVTGGFHTVVLPFLMQQNLPAPAVPSKPSIAAQTVLMRYSFEQLDALNGYAAGMPSPSYYQRIWEATQQDTASDHPFLQVATQLLIEIGVQTRSQKNLRGISTADTIAALEQARRLASFRNHPAPLRSDLLDAIRSCFVKGAIDAEGVLLMDLVQERLRGDRIGDLPPGASVPPIVEDFRQLATQFRLQIQTAITKSLTLDLYRKTRHRQISRFLHRLQFLQVPFGRMLAGPDFVQGQGLDRLQELWEYRWQPQTESHLIEQSLFGSTVEAAALAHLQTAIAHLEDEGKGRSATASVELLISACRMGLHRELQAGQPVQRQLPRLLEAIAAHIGEDPAFASLVAALNQLVLLWQSREPLEAHRLPALLPLITAAYQRACYLLSSLAHSPIEAANASLNGLCTLRELLQTNPDLDTALFLTGLQTLIDSAACPPPLLGGAIGVLYSLGQLTADDLIQRSQGCLAAQSGIGFLRGLLQTCREIAWTQPDLLKAIDQQLMLWDDEDFLRVLPELRLAFTDLTPRETERVAAQIAALYGNSDLGDLMNYQIREADLQLGLQINQQLLKSLEADGLTHWISEMEHHNE